MVRRMFLDPTASHLIISTTLGENYYLHVQSKQPRSLSRLKGVNVESVAWNPSLPTASTREVLVGTLDGSIYEVFIEPTTEFYRRDEKYLKVVYKIPDGPVTGLWVGLSPKTADLKIILLATSGRLLVFTSRIGRGAQEGGPSTLAKIFEGETPAVYDLPRLSNSAPSSLVLSPDEPDKLPLDSGTSERIYAWLSSQGVLHGSLQAAGADNDAGNRILGESKLLARSQIPAAEIPNTSRRSSQRQTEPIAAIALTQWHILALAEGRVLAVNRLDDRTVYDQVVLSPGQIVVGFIADSKKSTYWMVTGQEIFEIVVNDEERDIWRSTLR